jgi:L-asparaginase
MGFSRKHFSVKHIRSCKVGVLKLYPGILFEMLESFADNGIDGLILETFGAGNMPGSDQALPPVIEKIISNGTTVVVCSQCPQGSVHLGAYESGAALAQAGAVSGYNMTTEAAVTKLMWLLSQGKSQTEIKILMELDICGELDN